MDLSVGPLSPSKSRLIITMRYEQAWSRDGRPNANVIPKNRSELAGVQGAGIMSCRDTIHLICWYLERRLSPSVEHEIAEHLHGCADCRVVLDAATNTLDRYFGSGQDQEAKAASRAA